MRRSAVSMLSNIAEAWRRDSNKSFIQFLKIARASLLELETQLLIAVLLNYIEAGKEEVMAERLKEESKMINGFIKKLKD
jgi:four helix bundle protein